MAPTIDSAILKALSLDAALASITSHGGSGFSSTSKITTTMDGEEKLYFVKMGSGKEAEIMFAGEHTSLNALHSIVPSLCPQSHAHGALSSGRGFFLATDFLNLNGRRSHPAQGSSGSGSGSGLSIATKLAQLHSTPAPIPEGFERPQFGFPVPTCCGSTAQPNDYSSSWAEFFAERRLRAIAAAAEARQGRDQELMALVEKMAAVVVPRLLSDHLKQADGGPVVPVVVHGDLWSGNHGSGRIGNGPVEEVVFDPSSCYAHSEYELGIMRMFGGYGDVVFGEYHKLKPKDEPIDEYEDRIELYQLYHYLNHHTIFGGGYRSSAMSIMKRLDKKYGN